MTGMGDHQAHPDDVPALDGFGLRMAMIVAIVTIGTAALLLGFGDGRADLCSALRAGYPLCAL